MLGPHGQSTWSPGDTSTTETQNQVFPASWNRLGLPGFGSVQLQPAKIPFVLKEPFPFLCGRVHTCPGYLLVSRGQCGKRKNKCGQSLRVLHPGETTSWALACARLGKVSGRKRKQQCIEGEPCPRAPQHQWEVNRASKGAGCTWAGGQVLDAGGQHRDVTPTERQSTPQPLSGSTTTAHSRESFRTEQQPAPRGALKVPRAENCAVLTCVLRASVHPGCTHVQVRVSYWAPWLSVSWVAAIESHR